MPRKEDFYYLHFLRGGGVAMLCKAIGKALVSVGAERSEGKAEATAFIRVSVRKARQESEQLGLGSEATQALSCVACALI